MALSDLKGFLSGSVSVLYQDGSIENFSNSLTRDPDTGSFSIVSDGSSPAKIQFDGLTESMREETGYSAEETLIRVLQKGLSTPPNASSRVTTPRGVYLVRTPITEDPLGVYWELRCRLLRV